MQLQIKRIDQTLPLPEYQTSGSVAFDLYARIETIIEPGKIELIPLNVIIKVPNGFVLMVIARSSTPVKKGIMSANGVGIIDQDFCGEEDEILFPAYNFTTKPITISRGDRLAQALLVNLNRATIMETAEMNADSRGGFGSTG